MSNLNVTEYSYSALPRIEAWMFEDERLIALTKAVAERFVFWKLREEGFRQLLIIVANLFANWAEGMGNRTAIPTGGKNVCRGALWHTRGLRKTVQKLVPELHQNGAVSFHGGRQKQVGAPPHFSQIWATEALVSIFERFETTSFLHDWKAENRIVLRDADKIEVETLPVDQPDFVRSRDRFLARYNDLMASTIIDIPSNETGFVDRFSGKSVQSRIRLDKRTFVRSVFNESFEEGGRFYGGVWQELPRHERSKLSLNGEATVELDYGALHMALAYASVGIDYETHFAGEDAYAVPALAGFTNPLIARRIAKGLTLAALNAKSDHAAVNGFRAKTRNEVTTRVSDNGTPRRVYDQIAHDISRVSYVELRNILASIKAKHTPIAHLIGSGCGRSLQNLDSKIAEVVLRHFTDQGIPCLGVHDSFIVGKRYASELERVMRLAITEVAGVANVKISRKDSREQAPTRRYLDRLEALDIKQMVA